MTLFSARLLLPLVALLLLAILAASYLWPKMTLFHPDYRAERFRQMEGVFPTTVIKAAADPSPLPETPARLPETYTYAGETRPLDAFLTRSQTTAFLVLQSGQIRHEAYYQSAARRHRMTSFSVAKSYVSTLVGIALQEGLIDSLADPITKYLPALAESGYRDASIEDVLTMSSGVAFSEVYGDSSSDAYRIYNKLFLWMRPIHSVVRDYPADTAPGGAFHYASLDAQVLGLLVEAVSGQSLSAYLQTRLWQPLGATSDASWVTDTRGTALGFWGLNATARDFARLGLLFAAGGNWQGQQLLSPDWVRTATTPQAERLQRGRIDQHWGYGYQWWLPAGADQDFAAIGIWGQFIYVDPARDVVIVKLSADPEFKSHEPEAMAAFRAIAAALPGD